MPEHRTTSEKAYKIILKAIMENKLPKGEFISQRMLAKLSDTSIISVREALKRLEHEHLLEWIPRYGYRIPVETRERIINLYGIREALEVMVAYLISRDSSGLVPDKLYKLAEQCDVLTVDGIGDLQAYSDKHRALHLSIAEASGNHNLKVELEKLNLRSLLFQNAKSAWKDEVENPQYWHRSLLDEIYSGDIERAQAAMHKHIQHGLQYDLKMFDEGLIQ